MKIKSLSLALILFGLLSLGSASCSTPRNSLTYFENINTSGQVYESPAGTYNPVIQPDDELYIMITSYAPAATAAYNLPLTNPATSDNLAGNASPRIQTYLVDAQGNITMPVIGKIHVAGLTCDALRDLIIQKISNDVEDPNVLVRLTNFKVEVAGEVQKPGPQSVATERYSILDALSAAGDLTEFGERSNVLLIRDENGKRTAHRLNLNSPDILSSPYFYLRQNDYVYVEPNKIRQDNSKYNQNNAYKVTVVSTIVSACSVIASLVIALTVK